MLRESSPKLSPAPGQAAFERRGGNSSEGSLWQSEFSIPLRSLGFSQGSLTHSEVLSSQFGFGVQALSHLAVAEFTIKGTKDFFIKKSLMWGLNWIAAPSSAGTVTGGCSKVQLGFIYENLSGNGRKVQSYTRGHFIDCGMELFLVKHLNKNHISSLHSITVCTV